MSMSESSSSPISAEPSAGLVGHYDSDVFVVHRGEKTIILVGTAHVSQESVELVKGSHGAPAVEPWQRGVIVTSEPGVLEGPPLADIDVCELVLRQFGI
jgi:hypothetical protein